MRDHRSRFPLAALTVTASLLITSCGGDGGGGITGIVDTVAARVLVTAASPTLNAIGATVQLTARPENQNGEALTNKTIVWASSDDAIATVSGSGSTAVVTAVANGSVQQK